MQAYLFILIIFTYLYIKLFSFLFSLVTCLGNVPLQLSPCYHLENTGKHAFESSSCSISLGGLYLCDSQSFWPFAIAFGPSFPQKQCQGFAIFSVANFPSDNWEIEKTNKLMYKIKFYIFFFFRIWGFILPCYSRENDKLMVIFILPLASN